MSDRHHNWRMEGLDRGWSMPKSSRWKRIPFIRHVRAWRAMKQAQRLNAFWRAIGQIPDGYDEWVIYGIWNGLETTHDPH